MLVQMSIHTVLIELAIIMLWIGSPLRHICYVNSPKTQTIDVSHSESKVHVALYSD